jgi:hypothetical protein
MEPRHVVIEFWGGPLDGFHYGRTTDEVVHFPEALVAAGLHEGDHSGTYHIRLRRDHHYIYQWRESP